MRDSCHATIVHTDDTDLSFEYTHRNNIPLQIFYSYRIQIRRLHRKWSQTNEEE